LKIESLLVCSSNSVSVITGELFFFEVFLVEGVFQEELKEGVGGTFQEVDHSKGLGLGSAEGSEVGTLPGG